MGRPPHGNALSAHIGGASLEHLILDTTILVSADRGKWALDELIQDDDDVTIAAITAAELIVGVEMADSRHRSRRMKFVEAVITTFQIEDYDLRVARAHARLLAHVRKTGRPRGAHDLIIAATALSSRRTVLTADPAGFDGLPSVEMSVPTG